MQSKLILGTAQFGQQYGIKNDPVASPKEIEKIAQIAWEGGIRSIYTYDGYGNQSIINNYFFDFFKIYKRGVYPDWFEWNGKRGLSVYEMDEVLTTKRIYKEWDAYQFPINVLDKRFLPLIKDLKKDGYEIHARSVFLQGLLLMKDLPEWLSEIAWVMIKSFQQYVREENLEPYEAALGWVLGLEEIDHVIVGVNSAEQLKQLLKVKPLKWDYDFSIQDENVLNPRNWPKA